MQRSGKRGTPKHLEKMLFINHKEELALGGRLNDLNLRSRQRVIELDLDKIRLQKEWRNSRKKNMTLSEAIAAGILPNPDLQPAAMTPGGPMSRSGSRPGSQSQPPAMGMKRSVASAPPRKQRVGSQGQMPRSKTFFKEPRGGRESIINSFPKQPVIPENDDVFLPPPSDNFRPRRETMDTVGTYVLDEFEKVSQVVPDILRALAKKKEQYEEEKKNAQIAYDIKAKEKVNLMDYEPDMNKVRKTVSSVKKLRHRMAISKKLEVNKPKKSFDQMVKDRAESIAANDAFSDGICALMKRKLEKKSRSSSTGSLACDADPFSRRLSLANPGSSGPGLPRRISSLPDLTQNRRASMFATPNPLSRGGSGGLGFGAHGKLGSLGQGQDAGGLIDEDELINRQRIMKELGKYQLLVGKVERFLIQRRPGSRTIQSVLEQVTPIT